MTELQQQRSPAARIRGYPVGRKRTRRTGRRHVSQSERRRDRMGRRLQELSTPEGGAGTRAALRGPVEGRLRWGSSQLNCHMSKQKRVFENSERRISFHIQRNLVRLGGFLSPTLGAAVSGQTRRQRCRPGRSAAELCFRNEAEGVSTRAPAREM